MRFWILVSFLMMAAMTLSGCQNEPMIDGKKVSEWVDLLRHDDWTVQSQASDKLGRLGAVAIPFLKRSLQSKDPAQRRGAVIALGKIGEPAKETVKWLLARIAREEMAIIRAEIIRSLVRIDPAEPKVMEEFKKRLQDESSEVQEAARLALEQMEKKASAARAPEPAASSAPELLALRDAVAAEALKRMPGVRVGLVAEVVRESRRAAVVWPAVREGKIQDENLVAMVFEQKGNDGWNPLGDPVRLSQTGAVEKLSTALGGADRQRVVQPCGVPKEKLVEYLKEWSCSFKTAVTSGKDAEAMTAYENLGKAFSFSLMAFDNRMLKNLIEGKFCDGQWSLDQLELRSCGEGMVIGAIR
jgi:hypothetical protein